MGMLHLGVDNARVRGGDDSDSNSDALSDVDVHNGDAGDHDLDLGADYDGREGQPPGGGLPGRGRRRAPRTGTGEWFFMHRADPISPGHPVTILEACHWLASLKSRSRMTDDVVDSVCLMISKFLLPDGNLFPTSYHMVKATLGVENSKTYTDHICDKCWSVFPKLSPDEFADHVDDTCLASGLPGCLGGVCGNPRFDQTDTGVVLPKRSVYQFSIEETVRDLLEVTLSDWDQVSAQRMADFEQPETFWGSPAGAALDESCGHLFSRPPAGEIAVNFALGTTCTSAVGCDARLHF